MSFVIVDQFFLVLVLSCDWLFLIINWISFFLCLLISGHKLNRLFLISINVWSSVRLVQSWVSLFLGTSWISSLLFLTIFGYQLNHRSLGPSYILSFVVLFVLMSRFLVISWICSFVCLAIFGHHGLGLSCAILTDHELDRSLYMPWYL